jgi:nucleoside-diphosphate-sugar epimerase
MAMINKQILQGTALRYFLEVARTGSITAAAGQLDVEVRHGPPRPGDVRHSLADISAARRAFGFSPAVDLGQGMSEYMAWARDDRTP